MARHERKPYSVPQAIILGALIVVFVPMLTDAFHRWRAARVIGKWNAEFKASMERERRATIRRQHLDEVRRSADAKNRERAVSLGPDEICFGGTVVIQRMSRDGSASFVQPLEHGRPVRCKGRERLEPRP